MGRHIPPVHEALDSFLERFAHFYDPARQHGVRPLVALAAAHHRLMWVHRFLDGNGRVARLFTDAYFFRVGVGGYTDRALTEFCTFFLPVCLDQARYMDGQLALGGLVARLQGYVQLREEGIVPGPGGVAAPLRSEVAAVLRAAAVEGEIARGEAARLIGMSERTGRDILRVLLEEGLLVSPSERGPVRLFPADAAGYLFPDRYPARGRSGQTEVAERVMREDSEAPGKLSE